MPCPASSCTLASRTALRRSEGARVIQLPSGCMPMISECACCATCRMSVCRYFSGIQSRGSIRSLAAMVASKASSKGAWSTCTASSCGIYRPTGQLLVWHATAVLGNDEGAAPVTDARMLESYAAGSWFRSDADGDPLLDATTGETVARISSSGVDLGAMVRHAKQVGGPAIRNLTFHQRAMLMKELALHLSRSDIKDELYDVSFKTGATKKDSWVDIDGGIGTVFSYSSRARRELPNSTVAPDGPPEPLSKGGTFVGQHVFTSRPGVAVEINAFNFPVWGMLEKLAPAFIAGLPSIVKPASQTAYLTELAVRRIIEAGILPEGSLQLLCGSAGTLLDELTVQDSVAFTGSAHTAGILRRHESVLHDGVSLGVEADSLNCSILGADVSTDDPEFELFVKGVVAEMTVKAGQKCTAIRRVIVPEPMIDPVIEAISARLDRTTV